MRRVCWAAVVALALPGCTSGRAEPGEREGARDDRVVRRAVEDVFLLSGELAAVRSTAIVTPRGPGRLQIRWMAEDGAEVTEGDRLVDFDASNLIQRIEERRLALEQAVIAREGAERNAAAEAEKKRVAVEKAQVEADKAEVDAVIPREMRPAAEWRKFQATFHEKQAALEKARLEQEAYAATSRAAIEAARATEQKARRELAENERSLGSMSLLAPRSGIFLVGPYYQWGPEGPRKLQPGDQVWPSYPIGKIPDPGEMEVQAILPESDHGRVAPGMKTRSILDTYPDRVFEGEVTEVGSVASEGGRGWVATRPGFPVRVSLETTDPLMRPGLSVRVEVVRGQWDDALVVPRGAVRFDEDGPVVRRDTGADPVPVTLTACTPVECVVAEGLEEGDRVSGF
ncbi:MAG: efflux RND transporter periplasmic adaptor subunit [Acidobacteria bacterium]|nr:efflux RND transporter periplasmic adaptor subunit [Acidobacteriota bacterium]